MKVRKKIKRIKKILIKIIKNRERKRTNNRNIKTKV